jgi:geranylgeranyl pyrophosphate synthase
MAPKKGKIIVADLRRRSEKGLSLAKQILQTEKMEPLKLHNAFKHYIKNWHDYSHLGFFSLACEAVGGNPDDNLLPQAAIAMMAAAFDIHDDIIDKSNMKNKIPTVYGKYGVEIALLLGNAFLIEGLKLFADSTAVFSPDKAKATRETTRKLLFEVGKAHALEVDSKQRKQMTLENYMMISQMKAASIEADLMLGALFGGGNETEVASLARVGRILGVLATLREDLVDVFDIEELRQRIASQDLPTPLLLAMRDNQRKTRIKTILSKSKIGENEVGELVELTMSSASAKQMKHKMRLLIEEALFLLSKLPRKKLDTHLQAVTSFMLEDL